MLKTIKTVSIGEKVELILKFQSLQIKKTPSNQEYASVVGFDSKDLIDVKIWKLTPEKKSILTNGGIYYCTGMIKDYQNKPQFNVDDIRYTIKGEVNENDFFEYAPLSKEDLQSKISTYIQTINNEKIKKIVLTAIKKYVNEFFEYPAAMSIHHNYISGLAYHTYSMLTLSNPYLKMYPYLNRDLVYAGIILHDLGKVKELSGSKSTEYTKEGNLLGHISIGLIMLNEICKDLGYDNTEEALSLEHIILSHHGKLEFGSPKEPSIPEAALIFLLDYADSRFAALSKSVDGCDKGGYTDQVFAFDKRTFYIPDIE